MAASEMSGQHGRDGVARRLWPPIALFFVWIFADRRSHPRRPMGAGLREARQPARRGAASGARLPRRRRAEGVRRPWVRGSRVGIRPRHRENRAVLLPGIVRAMVTVSVVAAGLVSPVGAAVFAAPAAAAAPAAVGQQIREQLQGSHVSTAGYAVLDAGRVQTGGWGPGTDGDTPFVVGSISKSFTALAVVQLADRGVVDLDAPVTRYLPDFRTADPAVVITVRQLLDQTSGLPTEAGLDAIKDPDLSLRDRIAGAADVEPVSRPGKAFHYCNLNYAVLGYLVERVSDSPLATTSPATSSRPSA